MQTRVKICGINNIESGKAAIAAGADAIGLVFYQPSPRCVDVPTARQIALLAGPFVNVVGLFVDADADYIEQVMSQVPLHVLQFHGKETNQYCEQFQRPFIKALRMKPDVDVLAEIEKYPSAQGILLDAYRKGVPGGTGETFDWNRVPRDCEKPLVLAGGLTPENITEAVQLTRPYGVDVSGGVECTSDKKNAESIDGCGNVVKSASSVRKDPDKIQAFVSRAKNA